MGLEDLKIVRQHSEQITNTTPLLFVCQQQQVDQKEMVGAPSSKLICCIEDTDPLRIDFVSCIRIQIHVGKMKKKVKKRFVCSFVQYKFEIFGHQKSLDPYLRWLKMLDPDPDAQQCLEDIKKAMYLCRTHRVGRVPSFFSSRRNWDPHPPNPSPEGECAPPLLVPGGGAPRNMFLGGAHSLAREGWESPNSDEGTYTVVL